ncbi:hypothetical protein ACFL30_00915 [Candidatus Latescibacterota bacterium]
MRKTNEELDSLIADQETLIPSAADAVDIHRGHVSKSNSQLITNRREAITILENQKEITTVNLRSGL